MIILILLILIVITIYFKSIGTRVINGRISRDRDGYPILDKNNHFTFDEGTTHYDIIYD